jgi:hypothetical protein
VVKEALNDADTMIVETALGAAGSSDVTVVADDTDILVLLLFHYKPNMGNVLCYLKGHDHNLTKSV